MAHIGSQQHHCTWFLHLHSCYLTTFPGSAPHALNYTDLVPTYTDTWTDISSQVHKSCICPSCPIVMDHQHKTPTWFKHTNSRNARNCGVTVGSLVPPSSLLCVYNIYIHVHCMHNVQGEGLGTTFCLIRCKCAYPHPSNLDI